MNCIILCILGMVAMTYAATTISPRGCIWIMGQCEEECPEGTHDYTTGCAAVMPEATCKEPNPVILDPTDITCDFSDCYCDPPTVRDEATGKCVKLEDCTKQNDKPEVNKEEVGKEEVKEKADNGEEKKEDKGAASTKVEKDIKV